jgi:hypothetical protein
MGRKNQAHGVKTRLSLESQSTCRLLGQEIPSVTHGAATCWQPHFSRLPFPHLQTRAEHRTHLLKRYL